MLLVPKIEARHSQTGYLVPARYGLGLKPDGRVVRTLPPHLESQVDILLMELYLQYVLLEMSPCEISRHIETGVLQSFDRFHMGIMAWAGEECFSGSILRK